MFPNAVAEGRAQGFDRGWSAAPGGVVRLCQRQLGKVVQTGPITGGLFLEDDIATSGRVEFLPDHDQRVVAGGATWEHGSRASPLSASARYESGTPLQRDEEADEALEERPGADSCDFDRGRVKPRFLVSLIATCRSWTAVADARCAGRCSTCSTRDYAYNFGNPFSGTHFGAPRTASVMLRLETR